MNVTIKRPHRTAIVEGSHGGGKVTIPEQSLKKILIVGRSGALRVSLAAQLESLSARVQVSAAADDVLRALRETDFDFVLVETFGGAEAIRLRGRIQALRPECRVLFLSPARDRSPTNDIQRIETGLTIGTEDLAALLQSGAPKESAAVDPSPKIRSLIQTLDVVVSLVESEDPYFAGFAHRVAELADEVARKMHLAEDACEEITLAALLRDIGKAGLTRSLRDDPGQYEEQDVQRMRAHVEWTERLLAHVDFPWRIQAVVRHHHERYDGTGYPDGLAGRAIPIGARIIAAAETFIAVLSDRRHRPARNFDEARGEMVRSIGTQLDPEVVEVLLAVVADHPAIDKHGLRPQVLIVDSDVSSTRLLRIRLEDEGFGVTLRDSLDDLPTTLESRPPTLIVLDFDTIGSAGIERVRRLLNSCGLGPPISILVGADTRAARSACLKQGVDEVLGKNLDLEELVLRLKNILVRESRHRVAQDGTVVEGISGRLEAMGLSEITQFLALGTKTARLRLEQEDGTRTDIWFADGTVVHAVSAELQGHDAFFRALAWTSGTFLINHGLTTDQRSVESDATGLLMEGLRRIDEERAGLSGSELETG